MREIKVSVIVCAYNIETFIGPCLESILSQKTDFDFEILVGDDGSTDGTRDVISAFKEAYPEKIISVFREKNLGTSRNKVVLPGPKFEWRRNSTPTVVSDSNGGTDSLIEFPN